MNEYYSTLLEIYPKEFVDQLASMDRQSARWIGGTEQYLHSNGLTIKYAEGPSGIIIQGMVAKNGKLSTKAYKDLKAWIAELLQRMQHKDLYASVNNKTSPLLNKILKDGNYEVTTMGTTTLPYGTWTTVKVSKNMAEGLFKTKLSTILETLTLDTSSTDGIDINDGNDDDDDGGGENWGWDEFEEYRDSLVQWLAKGIAGTIAYKAIETALENGEATIKEEFVNFDAKHPRSNNVYCSLYLQWISDLDIVAEAVSEILLDSDIHHVFDLDIKYRYSLAKNDILCKYVLFLITIEQLLSKFRTSKKTNNLIKFGAYQYAIKESIQDWVYDYAYNSIKEDLAYYYKDVDCELSVDEPNYQDPRWQLYGGESVLIMCDIVCDIECNCKYSKRK